MLRAPAKFCEKISTRKIILAPATIRVGFGRPLAAKFYPPPSFSHGGTKWKRRKDDYENYLAGGVLEAERVIISHLRMSDYGLDRLPLQELDWKKNAQPERKS